MRRSAEQRASIRFNLMQWNALGLCLRSANNYPRLNGQEIFNDTGWGISAIQISWTITQGYIRWVQKGPASMSTSFSRQQATIEPSYIPSFPTHLFQLFLKSQVENNKESAQNARILRYPCTIANTGLCNCKRLEVGRDRPWVPWDLLRVLDLCIQSDGIDEHCEAHNKEEVIDCSQSKSASIPTVSYLNSWTLYRSRRSLPLVV